MLLAVVGFVSIAVMMYLLLKGKALPLTGFTVVPLVAAVCCGFGFTEIMDFITTGVSSTWATAVLFIFSIAYFGLMNDVGLFDKMVEKLVKVAGNNVMAVTLVTGVVAVIGHLDGSATTTYIITIGALLPLYQKMRLRPLVLLLICGAATGVMNLVPWGGPTARVAAVTGIDGNLLWHAMIPMQIFGLVAVFVVAAIFGVIEKKRLAREGNLGDGAALAAQAEKEVDPEVQALKRPKLFWFNLILTLVLLVVLCTVKIALYIPFLVATVIALLVNYPDLKIQNSRIAAHGASAIPLSATLIAAGIFLGVYVNSGMIEAMASTLINIVPGALQPYLHIIVGALGAPIGMTMGPDPYYYGIMPLIGEVVAQYGVPLEEVGYAMLIGENAALACSPCVPANYVALGLSGIALKDHAKFSFLWLWGISLAMLAFAMVTGLI